MRHLLLSTFAGILVFILALRFTHVVIAQITFRAQDPSGEIIVAHGLLGDSGYSFGPTIVLTQSNDKSVPNSIVEESQAPAWLQIMDLNNDGYFNAWDLFFFQILWRHSNRRLDFDNDGIVDASDLRAFVASRHVTPTPTPTHTPTPTPTALAGVFSSEVNRQIPDGGCRHITSVIRVPSNIYIHELKVGVWIAHEWPDDLAVDLVSPDGTRVRLFNEDFFDIEGVFGVDYPVSGPGDLSDFVGMNAKGNWTLIVWDMYEEDIGILKRWELRIAGRSHPPPSLTPSPTPSGRTYRIGEYFPLSSGLQWTYSSWLGTVTTTTTGPVKFCGLTTTRVTSTLDGETVFDAHFGLVNGALLNYGNLDFQSCSAPLRYGDDTIRDGTRLRQHVEANVEGADVIADFEIAWSYVGRRSVPAGVFDDCIALTVSIDAWDMSCGQAITGTWYVATLAPGVGPIEVAILDLLSLDIVDTATLTWCSLLGGALSKLQSTETFLRASPGRFSIAGAQQILENIVRQGKRKGSPTRNE